MSNLPLIVNSLAEAYGTSLMSEKSENIFKNILNQLHNNGSMLTQVVMEINEENRSKVMQILGFNGGLKKQN